MHQVVICTVGTSLITTWERVHSGKHPSGDDLLSFLKTGINSCAEANSLFKLDIKKDYDYIYLISSDNDPGKLCTRTLYDFYCKEGFRYVSEVYVPGLTTNYYDFQNRGLPNLIKEMSEIYENHSGMDFVINATGGYKAQTAFATLFGHLMGIEVVYIHEDFKSLIRFPAMPIDCNRSLIKEYNDTFQKILAADNRKEGRELIKSLPKSLQGFFEKSNGGYDYSAVGRVFLTALNKGTTNDRYVVRTYKNHTSLWGDGLNDLNSITDPQVRLIFRRLFDACEAVTAIHLDETKSARTQDTFMEYVETTPGALRYFLQTPIGSQYIKVEVLQGSERNALERLGRKIYA